MEQKETKTLGTNQQRAPLHQTHIENPVFLSPAWWKWEGKLRELNNYVCPLFNRAVSTTHVFIAVREVPAITFCSKRVKIVFWFKMVFNLIVIKKRLNWPLFNFAACLKLSLNSCQLKKYSNFYFCSSNKMKRIF